MNQKPNKIVHTMIEGPAETPPDTAASAEIDPSLKYESADGILHAYPPTLVADPEEMPWGYIRGPKLVRLPDGKWICALLTGGPTEPDAENHIMVATSEDDGKTWQKPVVLFKSDRRRCLPSAYFDSGGRLGLFIMTMIPDSYNLEQRSHLSWYDPDAGTWSVPVLVAGCPPVHPMRGFTALDGSVVFPAHWAEGSDQLRPGDLGEEPPQWTSDWKLTGSKREYRHVCGILTSVDGGNTFRVRGYVAHPDVNLWEPTTAEVAPGHYVMLLRAECTGFLYRSESFDRGETWSPPEPTDILNPSTKPTCLKIGDAILLFHNPNPGIGFHKRKQVEVWISRDGMKTWPQKIPLANGIRSPRAVCYPDPIYLPETHEIAVVLDTARKVHLQRIPCDDLGILRPR